MSEVLEDGEGERENDEEFDEKFDWSRLSDEQLMKQLDIYDDIVRSQLDESTKPMLDSLLEIERELALREEQPY